MPEFIASARWYALGAAIVVAAAMVWMVGR